MDDKALLSPAVTICSGTNVLIVTSIAVIELKLQATRQMACPRVLLPCLVTSIIIALRAATVRHIWGMEDNLSVWPKHVKNTFDSACGLRNVMTVVAVLPGIS